MPRKIGLLTQGLFGRTARLFNDFCNWLNDNNYRAFILNDGEVHDLRDVEFIVLPASELYWLWKNRKKINKNCHIMIWCMGCDALQTVLYNGLIKNKMYKMIFPYLYKVFAKKIIGYNALIYTDMIAENFDLNNRYQPLINRSSNVFPIPIRIDPPNVTLTKNNNVLLESLFWIGRIDRDFKIWSLLELLNDLNLGGEKNQTVIRFHIIGDGDGIDLIDSNQYSFDLIKHGNLPYNKMENKVRGKATLVFTIGTSVLEGARQSVSSVVVNPLKEDENNATYRWIFNSIGYSMGELKNVFVYPKQPMQTLDSILQTFMLKLVLMGRKSYNYVKKFNRDGIYKKIISSSNERPNFSVLKNSLSIPYLSAQLKNLIRMVIAKRKWNC